MTSIDGAGITSASIDIQERIAAQNRQAADARPDGSSAAGVPAQGAGSFADALASASGSPIAFSGHARTRLASRSIALTAQDLTRLGDALDRAAAKGARSSLVLLDSASNGRVGLVVSVPNRTVITAVDAHALKENIFTNIDSALIV